jgi:hypothetical protein
LAPVASSSVQVELLERRVAGLDESHAAAGDDALLDRRLGGADGVLDAVLALLELDLGGRADLDDRNTAGQLGQALLQLLAVVVGVDFSISARIWLTRPAIWSRRRTLDDGGLVLGDDDLAGLSRAARCRSTRA